MTTTQCNFCGAAATAIKIEADYDHSNDEHDVITQVRVSICTACAGHWYDGTEEFPGVLPL